MIKSKYKLGSNGSSQRSSSILSKIALLLILGTLLFGFFVFFCGVTSPPQNSSEKSKIFPSSIDIFTIEQRGRNLTDRLQKIESKVVTNMHVFDELAKRNFRKLHRTDHRADQTVVPESKVSVPEFLEKNGITFDLKKPDDFIIGGDGNRKIENFKSQIKEALGMNSVLLIIASNRPDYLLRCLTHILKYHPRNCLPIVVSEDGNNDAVAKVVEAAKYAFGIIAPNIPFLHVHHPQEFAENGYIKLSGHFKWALKLVFSNPFKGGMISGEIIERVIILEEDLQIASDFFEYFASFADMLDNDDSLLAVSAWNDNGQIDFVQDPKAVYRSDFFPGLGWMMPRRIWNELEVKWPKGYWDDWLREPQQRKNRHIIRPEICRTFHYGSHGVSNSQYSEYLSSIKLNDQYIKFLDLDNSYLLKNEWDRLYLRGVKAAPEVTTVNFAAKAIGKAELSIRYDSLEGTNSFTSIAHWAGIMDNIKANVPRTAYHGVVSVWKNGVKLHIAPKTLQ